MPTEMIALDSNSIRHAEFVQLTMPDATYRFCNAAAPISVDGMSFTNLGSLLNLGDIQRDIKATSDDLVVSLTGIDSQNIAIILSNDIKGSQVQVWRGFLDANNQIIETPTQQFFKRYQGIVANVSIQEDWNEQFRTRVATCTISCSSMRQILQNRVSGIKTNQTTWQILNPDDTSMNRTAVIASTYFDFGSPPQGGSQATPASSTPSNKPSLINS